MAGKKPLKLGLLDNIDPFNIKHLRNGFIRPVNKAQVNTVMGNILVDGYAANNFLVVQEIPKVREGIEPLMPSDFNKRGDPTGDNHKHNDNRLFSIIDGMHRLTALLEAIKAGFNKGHFLYACSCFPLLVLRVLTNYQFQSCNFVSQSFLWQTPTGKLSSIPTT